MLNQADGRETNDLFLSEFGYESMQSIKWRYFEYLNIIYIYYYLNIIFEHFCTTKLAELCKSNSRLVRSTAFKTIKIGIA